VAEFRWNEWNEQHIAEHGVTPPEAEYVVNHAHSPWPHRARDGRYLVWGRAENGHYLQVSYVFSPAKVVYVIHARPLNGDEKRQYGRRRR
jgi:uncharacterized DUF497 family protein